MQLAGTSVFATRSVPIVRFASCVRSGSTVFEKSRLFFVSIILSHAAVSLSLKLPAIARSFAKSINACAFLAI